MICVVFIRIAASLGADWQSGVESGEAPPGGSFTRGGSHHFLFLDDLALACDAVVISASSTVIIWDDRRLSVKVMERTTRRPGLVRRAGWRKDEGETLDGRAHGERGKSKLGDRVGGL